MSTQAGVATVLLAAVFLVAGCATTPRVSPMQQLQAQDSFERGAAAIERGELAAAMTAFQQAVALDPTKALYRNALGVALIKLSRPDLAAVQLRRAIELDPEDAESHLNLGTALAEQQHWGEAVTQYETALKLPRLFSPDTAHQQLGVALYNLKRYNEAEAELRFAISLEPKLQVAYYNLGLVYLAQGRSADARAVLTQARTLDPNSRIGMAAFERLKALGEGG